MSEKYNVQFDTKLKIDPEVMKRAGEQAFWGFINCALPGHEEIVLDTLRHTPAFLEIVLSIGYRPFVASRHTLNTVTGDIEVGIVSEMAQREGNQSTWRTAITSLTD